MRRTKMKNEWYWCSRDLEPDYVNCRNCPSGCNPETCQHRHAFHADAVRWCDDKRRVKGLPLIADDFDWMKENFKKKGFAEQSGKEQEQLSEQMKREALQRQPSTKSGNDLMILLGGFAVILIIALPVAYLFPILTLFTEFLFDIIDLFSGNSTPLNGFEEPIKESFFYSEYWSRYLYCASLMSVVWVWVDGLQKDNTMRVVQMVMTGIFILVALFNINLVIGTVFGPIFIIFGLLITAK